MLIGQESLDSRLLIGKKAIDEVKDYRSKAKAIQAYDKTGQQYNPVSRCPWNNAESREEADIQ